MSPTAALTPWALVTATAGLIAFQLGLLTLVGRERKSPHIINRAFPIFLVCLLVAAVSVAASVLPTEWTTRVLSLAAGLLVFAILLSLFSVYRIAIRFVYFVDSVNPKYFWGIRQLRRWWGNMRSPRPTYQHNTVPVPDDLRDELVASLKAEFGDLVQMRDDTDLRSLAVATEHQWQSNRILAELARAFLVHGFSVQYMTTSRHPIEFVTFLRQCLADKGVQWPNVARQVVVVDAYSPHFAFIDSIYPKKTQQLQALDVTCVTSTMTYAGVHSASSDAFNRIKAQMARTPRDSRQPTLVIYENLYALADLESAEQYRIFVRHVLPSERMWDGMFTVFIECSQPEADWSLLHSYAAMKVDLRRTDQLPHPVGTILIPQKGK